MARPDLVTFFAVGLGGALGSAARFAVHLTLARPWGTLAVNVGGCLAMGLLLGSAAPERAKAFLAVGLLGGFTTFSGLALDLYVGWQAGERTALALYVAASLVGGVLALCLGVALSRAWGG